MIRPTKRFEAMQRLGASAVQKSQKIEIDKVCDKVCIDKNALQHERAQRVGFSRIARVASNALGTARAFVAACVVVLVWALTGPLFHFSEVWQLVINTGATIVTFLMVFLIQNTQNRDARAIHLKLDELIRSIRSARNRLIDLENCSDKDLDAMEHEFDKFRGQRRVAVMAAKETSTLKPENDKSPRLRPITAGNDAVPEYVCQPALSI
jgi:low affinity Fe/Cu permease